MGKDLFNHDVEVEILSILVQNNDRIYGVMDSIYPEMFSSSVHAILFDSIIEIFKRNNTVTNTLLRAYLSSNNKLDKVGGPNYIDMLSKINPDETSLDAYIVALSDMYKSRQLLALANEIPDAVTNTTSITSLVSNLKHKLNKLEISGSREDVVKLSLAFDNIFDNVFERINSPGIRGIATKFPSLDRFTSGFSEGDLWIIAGRPSMGKTTKMLQDSINIGSQGFSSLFISREMRKEELIERIIAQYTGVNHDSITLGTITEKEQLILKDKKEEIKRLPIYFDTNFFGDENYIGSVIRKYVKLHGIKVVFIDYIQLVAERGFDQTAELGRISRALKLLALDLGITIVIGSQLNRDVEKRDDKRPILADLRQSGNLEEDADIVIGLYRPYVYQKNPDIISDMYHILLKNRNGRIGELKLNFDENTLRITDYTAKYTWE